MGKSFCERVKNVNPNKDLDNVTVNYRLNNFIKACNISLDGAFSSKIDSNTVLFSYSDGSQIAVIMTNNIAEGKKHNIIEGQYQGLNVSYYDRFSPSVLNKGYSQIPVNIIIEKLIEGCIGYKIRIVSTVAYPNIIEFSMARRNYQGELSEGYDYTYQCSITGFNDVLALISQFMQDPETFYEKKLAVIRSIKIRLNAKQADELIGDNSIYPEPSEKGMLKKAIGTLFDRHKKQ